MLTPRLTNALTVAESHGFYGLAYQHISICETRAWLFLRKVDCAHVNRFMQKGILLHQSSYRGKLDRISGLGIRPDQIDFQQRIVYEVKSSKSHDHAARLQLAFYVALMSFVSSSAWSGVMRYPAQRRTAPLIIDELLQEQLISATNKLVDLQQTEIIPTPFRQPICKGCSFQLLCWGEYEEED